MDAFTKSFLLLFVLLNPFILSVYLLELLKVLDMRSLAQHLVRASTLSAAVFVLFAWAGEAFFQDVLQLRFASFLIFGGITFLIIGIRLIQGSGPPIDALRPDQRSVSAAIAMPFLVGPGTISASVLAGSRLSLALASGAIVLALGAAIAAVLVIKALHDLARTHHERLVQKYAEVAGRVTALFTGSFAIEMILNGIERWLAARS